MRQEREISMNIVSSTKIPKYSYVSILEGKFNILSKTKEKYSLFLREFLDGT